MRKALTRFAAVAASIIAAAAVLTGCASFSMFGEEISRSFKGAVATYQTYDKVGNVMDSISGVSVRVTRDTTFDEFSGESTKKGSMILVQVGKNEIRHVGSTATLIQDGIDVVVPAQTGIEMESSDTATPFMEKIFAQNANMWKGSAKTVLVRTQDDIPVAVFSGKNVELFKSDIPNSTALRVTGVDGEVRYALVYRANLSVYDTELFEH